MSHDSLRRPRRTKQAPRKKHPRPLHVDPSDLEQAARGRSWDTESGLCTVSGPGPHPWDTTGSHPFLTPATQTQQVPAGRAEHLKVQVLALSLELCDLWQVLRLLRLSCKMGILAINVKVLCT